MEKIYQLVKKMSYQDMTAEEVLLDRYSKEIGQFVRDFRDYDFRQGQDILDLPEVTTRIGDIKDMGHFIESKCCFSLDGFERDFMKYFIDHHFFDDDFFDGEELASSIYREINRIEALKKSKAPVRLELMIKSIVTIYDDDDMFIR